MRLVLSIVMPTVCAVTCGQPPSKAVAISDVQKNFDLMIFPCARQITLVAPALCPALSRGADFAARETAGERRVPYDASSFHPGLR